MDPTGSTSTESAYWALRSASSNYSYDVGYVFDDGHVSYDLNVYDPWAAVVPACLIG